MPEKIDGAASNLTFLNTCNVTFCDSLYNKVQVLAIRFSGKRHENMRA